MRAGAIRWWSWGALAICIAGFSMVARGLEAADEDGFQPIFNGKDLAGWDGDPELWSVHEGAIRGQTTPEKKLAKNRFLIWRQGELDDFVLRLSYRIVGGNSGIQYRSKDFGDHVVGGYQADLEAGDRYSGILYEEKGRGILADRGQRVEIDPKGKRQVTGIVGKSKEIQQAIKKEDWNEYEIVARGPHLIHRINGRVTAEVFDHHQGKRAEAGILAFQVHVGPPMTVDFKNVRLKRLPLEGGRKKIVFVAGRPSHAPGDHEHNAGVQLLAKCLNQQESLFATFYLHGPEGVPSCITDGKHPHWGLPEDPTAFDNADSIVIYCDGGGGHPLHRQIERFDEVMKRGVGLACLHYAVEIPKGKSGNKFLEWMGGYFETHWSINPHWNLNPAKIATEHPIARGVKPFVANDEWYYHMRFRPGMKNVEKILWGLPPDETRFNRGLGAHAGNEHVRKRKGMEEILAWAATRPDGGRGFGYTGGHFHKNWAIDDLRKLVVNAIAWTAKAEIPAGGFNSKLTPEDLEANLDPKGRRRRRTAAAPPPKPKGERRFQSKVVNQAGQTVDIDVDVSGMRDLFLVVSDAGDGYGCDWADWIEPRFVAPDGETKLTVIKWKSATSGWGQPLMNQNAGGGPLKVGGKPVAYGIGTHANSVIHFRIPKGTTRFKAKGGLDNGGSDQSCGSTVTFEVYVGKLPKKVTQRLRRRPGATGALDPQAGREALVVHEGLEAKLFAHEPMVVNPTNLDIDARGRVWVTEGVNYRRWNGMKKEGDRIVILEDTDLDGVADRSKVFYQDPSINSALGIAVFGKYVYVSCSPNIFVFTDENQDDIPDSKKVLFTGIAGVQHDHGAHAFVFGPDGKLYWNFGNSGRQLLDPETKKPIVDRSGRRVVADGKPYRQGMVFRCNPDGSDLEVLGHNFRNNYEVAIDAYGTLWQSDNDDDGNRGVRINYVMEYGNFGYRDELTGAGWQAKRTNMPPEKPERHWYQNSPGVVPNLLQTYAGSPTGICVYEGSLLPEVFRNQMIHCDAGPNVVRAYPVKKKGAGYSAEIVDLVQGGTDRWFRPSDVCVASDGAVFISDWYDPGVGGHNMQDNTPGEMRGRIYRVAPKGHRRSIPALDLSIAGAAKLLSSPNMARRYLAFGVLEEAGEKARGALEGLWQQGSSRQRARALYLLAKLADGDKALWAALADPDADIRVTALRAARQTGQKLLPYLEKAMTDASAQVRRECALALRHVDPAAAARVWGELASLHEAGDRWNVEALGIGAQGNEEAAFRAWLEKVGEGWSSPAGRDIVWRSRSPEALGLLAEILHEGKDSPGRYLRSFDFHADAPAKNTALVSLAAAKDSFVSTEAVGRVKGFDPGNKAEDRAVVEALMKKARGTGRYAELAQRFGVPAEVSELFRVIQKESGNSSGATAARLLLEAGSTKTGAEAALRGTLASDDVRAAIKLARALGDTGDGRALGLLTPILASEEADPALVAQAVRSVARQRKGAELLLEHIAAGKLEDAKPVAQLALRNVPWAEVRDEARKLLPPRRGKGEALPPLAELVKRRGQATEGRKVFETNCANCHQAEGGQLGKDYGPSLAYIGDKLPREALYVSILDPNAGVSFDYEGQSFVLKGGDEVTGIVTSETGSAVTVKTTGAVLRDIPKSDILAREKLNLSIMPAGLEENLTTQELVNLVEFLTTQKAK